MDNNLLWMNYDHHDFVHADLELSAWDIPLYLESEMREDNIFGAQLMQEDLYSNPFYQDTTKDEFATLLDGNNGFLDGIIMELTVLNEDKKIVPRNIKVEGSMMRNKSVIREARVLTFEEVSQYFYMPIVQAAKELNVGLTLLKKRCRELGIPRWPHRKMKSMQTLIKNVQDLGWEEGSVADMQVKDAIARLEQEKMLMEITPSVQMHLTTKRLRQACFKANYKKRRLVAGKAGNL